MKRFPTKALCLLGLALWLPQAPGAADLPAADRTAAAQAEAAADLRDPAALAEFRRAAAFLTALPRFHLRASMSYDVVQEDGRHLQFEKRADIYLQRPDRLYAEVRRDDGRWGEFWYDGTMLSVAKRSENIHTRLKAPPTIDSMLDMLEGLVKEPMPLSDLLYNDLAPLDQLAVEADVVGDSLVNGRPCLHLAFRGETVDWQFWVEQGATPFVRKLAISYREMPGTPQYVAWLDEWDTPDRFEDDRFTFVAPEGSQAISVLVSMPRRIEEGDRP